MDHLPFEDWLLEQKSLNPQQTRELNAHLQTCRSCSALAEVDIALQSARQLEPARGFVNRFQGRLVEQKLVMRRRNVIGFSLLGLSVAGLITGLAWPVLRTVVESPVDLAASWISSLVGLWASIHALIQAGMVLFRVAPGFVPAYIWAVLLFGLTGWSVAWVFSLLKFTKIPQGV